MLKIMFLKYVEQIRKKVVLSAKYFLMLNYAPGIYFKADSQVFGDP